MKVYVILHGELHEGGQVVSVHKFRKNAVKVALAMSCYFPGGWQEEEEGFWVNGCDFVKIEEVEVQP
jgi:hypothetical protein